MTQAQAIEWVRDHADEDNLNPDELDTVFFALFGREPDKRDREEGLWSHCCAATDDSGDVDAFSLN